MMQIHLAATELFAVVVSSLVFGQAVLLWFSRFVSQIKPCLSRFGLSKYLQRLSVFSGKKLDGTALTCINGIGKTYLSAPGSFSLLPNPTEEPIRRGELIHSFGRMQRIRQAVRRGTRVSLFVPAVPIF